MIRRLFRFGLLLGLIGGVAFALTKLLRNQSQDATPRSSEPWPRLRSDPTAPIARAVPDPEAPAPRTPTTASAWIEPTDGVCPASHPVKAKMASKIFHLPGMANYDRTTPDRCYVDPAQAEADGLRASKR